MSQSVSKYYPDQIVRSLDELDRLLVLAEQVSGDLASARSSAFRQIGYFFLMLVGISLAGFTIVFTQPKLLDLYPGMNIISLLAGLGTGVIIATYAVAIVIMSINQRKWRVERQIVTDILVMASSILEPLQSEIGSVEYTVLRMRMRRLGMSEHSAFAGIRFG